MKRNVNKLFLGIILLIIGLIYSGNVLEFWNVNLFFPGWWTLFIIVPSISSMVKFNLNMANGLTFFIGVLFLLTELDYLTSKTLSELCIPILFIIVGLSTIKSFFRKPKLSKSKSTNQGNEDKNINYDNAESPRYSIIFKTKFFKNMCQTLKKVRVISIFSKSHIDLSTTNFNSDVEIEIITFFGAATIYAPTGTNIKIVSSTPLFGNFSYKMPQVIERDEILKVKYTTIFGNASII